MWPGRIRSTASGSTTLWSVRNTSVRFRSESAARSQNSTTDEHGWTQIGKLRSSRRKDVLNIQSELNRLFDLRHQRGRKLSELSFQSRQRYRTNSLNVGYGEFCQERQLAQFNFVTTASVLRGERDIDKEDP